MFSALPVDLFKVRVPQLRTEIDRLLHKGAIDLCVADFLVAARSVPADQVPVILFEHNVESILWQRLAKVERRAWRRAVLEIEWRKMRRFERMACARSRMVIAVSPEDRDALLRDAPAARIRAIGTGVDTSYFTANGTPERSAHLVFTGA